MNRQDRKYIIKELSEYGEWMRDSSAYDCDDTIDGLIKNAGDYYEVIVDIHLINGDCITVRNNCKESYLRKKYIGDSIEYSDLGDPDGIGFDVNYIKNGAFHQARIPISSICWIEGHTKDVDWKRVKLDIATIKDRGLWNAFLRGKNMKPTNQTEKRNDNN